VTFTRAGEDGVYRRVPQVIDAWFDSGSMPFAQFGAPYRNAGVAAAAYPADFICEAIDQTRGWFYTLMAIGTLVFDQSPYRNVLCLGHILADDGRKMSKHLGNILEPMQLMDDHGADAVRWFMLAGGSPWASRRIGPKLLDGIASKVLRTYWSLASFQSLYARANSWAPGADSADEERASSTTSTLLDRWARSELHRVTAEVDDALEGFDTQRAGRALAGFIDELSNWYVRRSRRRFWEGDPAALGTLHECLHVLTRLLAPFVPFVTERVWQAMFSTTKADSVHLAHWPVADLALVDVSLGDQVATIRRLTELGRAARAESAVKTRQPLARALVSAPGWAQMPAALRREIADELNVADIGSLGENAAGALVDVVVKPNFRVLGRRFGGRTQEAAQAIGVIDPQAFVDTLAADGVVAVDVAGEPFTISSDEVVVSETPRSGWAVAAAGSETVALDLELTHGLRLAGIARDVVRLVQGARKDAGFEVTDRIELRWRVGGSPDPAEAIRAHGDQLAAEVLATALVEGSPADTDGWVSEVDDDLGLHLWLRKTP